MCGGSVALEHSSGVLGSATPGALRPFLHLSSPEAPSLLRRYPLSTVVRASPPPCPAPPVPCGILVWRVHATDRASRVAAVSLLRTCHRPYPGGTDRCSRRSLPGRWQPSPFSRRVGFRVALFEACSTFTARSLNRPWRPFSIAVLQSVSLLPRTAPITSGWSDSCRAGFAPAEKQRLSTAHEKSGLVPPPGTARIIQAETRGVLESEREPRQSRPVCHWCCMPQG